MVSIIVPVYNAEKYLHQCIESILNQSCPDFELLLIDDGSKDSSAKICDEYARKDNRIRVFHKKNGGVSSARNLGLVNAKGEYVYFADADDEVLPQGLESLVERMQQRVDVVFGGVEMIGLNGKNLIEVKRKYDGCISRNGLLEDLADSHDFYQGFLWNKLFKNSVIQTNNLRFDEKIYFNEDRLFVVQYVCASNKTGYLFLDPVYRYFVRENSAMSSLTKGLNKKFITDYIAVRKILSCIDSLDGDKPIIDGWKKGVKVTYSMYFRSLHARHNPFFFMRVMWHLYRILGLRETYEFQVHPRLMFLKQKLMCV